jgi:hypothetical protein
MTMMMTVMKMKKKTRAEHGRTDGLDVEGDGARTGLVEVVHPLLGLGHHQMAVHEPEPHTTHDTRHTTHDTRHTTRSASLFALFGGSGVASYMSVCLRRDWMTGGPMVRFGTKCLHDTKTLFCFD